MARPSASAPVVRAPLAASMVAAFVLSGRALFTIVSPRTGVRFTFKVNAPRKDRATGEALSPEKAGVRFVSVLTGPDNESSYSYVGNLFPQADGGSVYRHGKKAVVGEDAPSAKAAAWFFSNLGRLPAGLEVWHEGKCCRCGRTLSVPSSIASGVGPECARKREG